MTATDPTLPSRTLLEEAPARTLNLLRGIGTNADIDAIMLANGYTTAVANQGWALLFKASGYSPSGGSIINPAADAIRQLSDWNSVGFHRMHAALTHLHPAQEEFVFHDINPATGADAIVSTGLLLDRLDALESGPGRTATREADKKALDTLAERGIDAKERARLRKLVDTAKVTATMGAPPVDVDARTAALVDLRAWYADWAETAHAVLTRRGDLIKLGLAKRQSRTHAAAPTTPTTPTTPAGSPA